MTMFTLRVLKNSSRQVESKYKVYFRKRVLGTLGEKIFQNSPKVTRNVTLLDKKIQSDYFFLKNNNEDVCQSLQNFGSVSKGEFGENSFQIVEISPNLVSMSSCLCRGRQHSRSS
jgi:hypothetical protein